MGGLEAPLNDLVLDQTRFLHRSGEETLG